MGDEVDIHEPRLCHVCLKTILADGSADRIDSLHADSRDYPIVHHPSRASLLQSITFGCYICCQIRSTGQERIRTVGKVMGDSESTGKGLWEIYIRLEADDQSDPRKYFVVKTFSLASITGSESAFEHAEKSLSQAYTGHVSVLDLASQWFRDCLDCHDPCRRNLAPSSYPTRLLDVSSTSRIVLVNSIDIDPYQAYATLSYCWGLKPFLTLTSSNQAQFLQGLDIAEFPQLFQDIMKTAQHLGIRYVWIDAYCIMQYGGDSDGDWLQECSRMTQVYEDAVLNFGATHASSPLDNCFTTRQATPSKPFVVDWQPQISTSRMKFHLFDEDEDSAAYYSIWESNLFKRAWVFQERLLCPRMLHFYDSGIGWECSGVDRRTVLTEGRLGLHVKSTLRHVEHTWSLEQPYPLISWSRVAGMYSRMKLTFPAKDKLLALSTIAVQFSRRIEDEYVAGMFRTSLLQHLQWYCAEAGSRGPDWRAPSWSWLSMDTAIQLPYRIGRSDYWLNRDMATVLSISIDLMDANNPYGAMRSASLRLRCRPIKVQCQPIPRPSQEDSAVLPPKLPDSHVVHARGFSCPWRPDDAGEYRATEGPTILVAGFLSVFPPAEPCREQIRHASNISVQELVSSISTEDLEVHALVLRSSVDKPGTFSRLGRVQAYFQSQEKEKSNSFFDLWFAAPEETLNLT